MRRQIACVIVAMALAGPAGADSVDGTWKTAPATGGGYGTVAIAPCGAKICGTLTKAYDKTGKEVASADVGKQIISNMVAKGGGTYSGGTVYSPARGKSFDGTMTRKGNALDVSACELGVCRGQIWTRIK